MNELFESLYCYLAAYAYGSLRLRCLRYSTGRYNELNAYSDRDKFIGLTIAAIGGLTESAGKLVTMQIT